MPSVENEKTENREGVGRLRTEELVNGCEWSPTGAGG